MNASDGRDLDLNLLRVFLVVAETGSVTAAGARLYLTQPAISAALKRLTTTVGAPLFARQGRGLVLTARGRRLEATARPHLAALVQAALAPAAFDPRTSEATLRLGLSDANEPWLLPPILRVLAQEAPKMRLLVVPVQFRNVGEALASGRVDVAVTVADEVPAGTLRELLFVGDFTCLFDPREAHVGRPLTLERYLAHEHVLVSYNGDFRGVVEDFLGIQRRVRCSVGSFQSVADVVDGTPLLATIPTMVARGIVAHRPHLAMAKLPFVLRGTGMELLTSSAAQSDEAVSFLRAHIVAAAARATRSRSSASSRARRAAPRPPS